MLTGIACHGALLAEDVVTYAEAFNAPVFDSVDENGVDLVTGSLRVTTPIIAIGSEGNRRVRGMQWTGRAWTLLEQPTIWRDGDKYIVNYRGSSREFNDHTSTPPYGQRKPIDGSKLDCSIFVPGNLVSECVYTDRTGDVVHFKGRPNGAVTLWPNYGPSSYAWGNLGMIEASVISVDNGRRKYGYADRQYPVGEGDYYKREVTLHLDGQFLKIVTQNHDADTDEHYLRPDNTIQTVADTFGTTWQYVINDNRRMTRIVPPGGAAAIDITYNDGKVKTVTNANGTWTYAYTTLGDYGTTTVTNPLGETIIAKYHIDRGYVTESRDALNNTTLYSYDSGHRPEVITYPEGNYVKFVYDARGNIKRRETYPKPSIGGTVLIENADYDSVCSDAVICNRPRWIEDARGSLTASTDDRTDFEYEASTEEDLPAHTYTNSIWKIRVGTGKPRTITSPAPSVGAIRPQVRNTYASGMLVRSSICMTQVSCAGTADEVITEFDYGGTEGSTRTVFGKSITSNGQTLRTCYGYDNYGRMISETPPAAGVSSCPLTVTTAAAATSTMPSVGTAPFAPTYPDVASGSGGTGGGGSEDPPIENCGENGRICN